MTQRPPAGPPPELQGYHLPEPRRSPQQRGGSGVPPSQGGPAGKGRRAPPPTRGSWLKTILLGAGFLLLTAATFVTAFVIGSNPAEIARTQLPALVKSRTGRDLAIGGASLKFFPSLGIVLTNVTLSLPPGSSGPPTAKVGALDVSVRLAALLKRDVEVERLVLRDADIDLRVDKTGKRSWELAAEGDPTRPLQYAQLGAGAASDAKPLPPEARDFLKNAADETVRQAGVKPSFGGISGLSLEDVRLENARLRYTDERAGGAAKELSAINATLSLKDIDAPLAAAGSLVVQGEKVDFDGHVTTLADVLAARPAKLTLNVAAAPVKGSFEGALRVGEAADVNGQTDITAPSLRDLARWLGSDLPPAAGYGPFALRGNVKAAGKSIALTDAKLGLDGATATGSLTLDATGERPMLRGSLKASEIDLNKYAANETGGRAPQQRSKASPAVVPAGGPASGEPNGQAAPRSIDDLLKSAGPKVKGYVKRAGWSEEPIPVVALASLDADLALSAQAVKTGEVKTGQSVMKIALAGGQLKATIEDVALYGGHAHGLVTVDGSAGVPAVGISLVADGVDAQPLLKDAAGFDKLSGMGKLVVAVAGSGASQKAIIDAMTGTASFTFSNGAIVGYNVAGMLRGLSQGKITGLHASPSEKTDFSELSASFNIQNGVADNQDLKLLSPLLRVAGAGRVMLGARQVDYVARPKLTGSLSGQGGAADAAGIEVPVRISGSWDDPQIAPDLTGALGGNVQGLIKDPSKAAGTVKEIGKQLGGKKAGDLLKGLLGKN